VTRHRKLLTVQSRGPFLAEQRVHDDAVQLVVVHGRDAVCARLISVFSDLPADWPLYEARRLDAELKRQGNMALFAAVLARQQSIAVCTAGDIRVHLAWGGSLRETTRDHTYATDPLFEREMKEVHPLMRAVVATRCVGSGANADPEMVHWQTPDDYVIAVCSSEVHQHRPPATYVDRLLSGSVDPLLNTTGFLLILKQSLL
jgi:serine/threonine protein phosphatase PrpC